MSKIETKAIGSFLAITMILSLWPSASFGDTSTELGDGYFSAIEAEVIPTAEQIENAAPNQLIVTYKSSIADLNDSIQVADIEGESLEKTALSDPDQLTTLSELGAKKSDRFFEEDETCEASPSSLLTFDTDVDLQEVSAQLLSSPDVEAVQPNYRYELSALGTTSFYDQSATRPAKHPTNDPYSYVDSTKTLNQNYIYTTKVADAWNAGYKSSGKISIAVIDSGVRTDHPDLVSSLDLSYARDFTTTSYGNGTSYSDYPQYWTGRTGFECHGTWVSGILAATANNGTGIAGTSYNANIIPLKVTNGQTLYTSTIVRAYSYLDDLVESGKLPSLKVINLSLGGRESDPSLKLAISHMASSHKILTVASAGNYGDSGHTYPADYSNVLSVMSVNQDFTRSSFSNYGSKDVSAPGTSITTTIPYSSSWSTSSTGKYSKRDINGTSFSAPIASGVAALCYASKPSATASEVRYSIISGATSLNSIDSTCAPYLNALQAVKNTISGKGLYEATHKSIAEAKISAISAKTYSGKKLTPKPKVSLNGKTLKRGVDYSLSYSNNKGPGKATITIKAIGAYKGSKKVTFKINPKTSKISKVLSKTASFTVKWKKVSCSSGYQIRYSTSSKRLSTKKLKTGKTVTVYGKKKSSKTISKLKRSKKYYIQVRTYKQVNKVKYYSKWSSLKTTFTR